MLILGMLPPRYSPSLVVCLNNVACPPPCQRFTWFPALSSFPGVASFARLGPSATLLTHTTGALLRSPTAVLFPRELLPHLSRRYAGVTEVKTDPPHHESTIHSLLFSFLLFGAANPFASSQRLVTVFLSFFSSLILSVDADNDSKVFSRQVGTDGAPVERSVSYLGGAGFRTLFWSLIDGRFSAFEVSVIPRVGIYFFAGVL